MNDEDHLLHVIHQFDLDEEAVVLPGGSTKTFRVGNVVLKRIRETSLENNHSPTLIQWIADFSLGLNQDGFRSPKPLSTIDHTWITSDGWTAWTYLEGRHAACDDIPECLTAIKAFHQALKSICPHPLMADNRTPWGQAHRGCLGEKPDFVQPQLRALVDRLYTLRRPIRGLESQLIHGDLNPENILIAPGRPPAFLDFSPFWAPPEFAIAIFANFIGPRRGDASALSHFEGIGEFDQLLVRAGIRMLLVMSVSNRLDDWDTCSEKRAAELIIEYVSAK